MRKLVAVITLILVLGVVNWSIYKKEQLLENGQIVYLKLVPVDPRSLMQGDYMALRFAVSRDIGKALSFPKSNTFKTIIDVNTFDGFALLSLDENNVGSFINISKTVNIKNTKAIGNMVAIKFRQRGEQIKIGTNAFFFEEGKGDELEMAKYGKFRVNASGDLLLVSLADETFNLLAQ